MARNVNIHDFMEKMNENYRFLYDHDDNVAGFDDAVVWFDDFSIMDKNKKFLNDFVQYRGDFISSDREAAAFAFTMEDFGLT